MWWRQGGGVVLLTAVAASQALVAQDPETRYRAGYEALRITDPARTRPIQLDVWYPAEADETTHRYGLLSTGRVAPGAPMAAGRFPVILLSHGALGAATNYSWIAERLARSAFVVVGVSHFGESRVFGEATINLATVADFGARTRDFSFALDFVLQRSKWASGVDGGRVGALGHSSGGATVAMLAGGQYRPEAMTAFCLSKAGNTDRGCGYRAGAPTQTVSAPPIAESRVRAVVLLDPAVGPGFDRPGLAGVKAPRCRRARDLRLPCRGVTRARCCRHRLRGAGVA
jgi:predicted dienelactone hydrolase